MYHHVAPAGGCAAVARLTCFRRLFSRAWQPARVLVPFAGTLLAFLASLSVASADGGHAHGHADREHANNRAAARVVAVLSGVGNAPLHGRVAAGVRAATAATDASAATTPLALSALADHPPGPIGRLLAAVQALLTDSEDMAPPAGGTPRAASPRATALRHTAAAGARVPRPSGVASGGGAASSLVPALGPATAWPNTALIPPASLPTPVQIVPASDGVSAAPMALGVVVLALLGGLLGVRLALARRH